MKHDRDPLPESGDKSRVFLEQYVELFLDRVRLDTEIALRGEGYDLGPTLHIGDGIRSVKRRAKMKKRARRLTRKGGSKKEIRDTKKKLKSKSMEWCVTKNQPICKIIDSLRGDGFTVALGYPLIDCSNERVIFFSPSQPAFDPQGKPRIPNEAGIFYKDPRVTDQERNARIALDVAKSTLMMLFGPELITEASGSELEEQECEIVDTIPIFSDGSIPPDVLIRLGRSIGPKADQALMLNLSIRDNQPILTIWRSTRTLEPYVDIADYKGEGRDAAG